MKLDPIRHAAILSALALTTLTLSACEVPDPPPDGGGLDDDGDTCGPGVVVVSTDYQSASIAFVRWDGTVASANVLSSGSAEVGLSAPLSGDVVTPTVMSSAGETVLVDRYPASVLTWVDVEDGTPQRQLSLRTGFDANAQDYVAASESKGYVSRYEANPSPGREPFDAGSDVLVLEPQAPAIVGRIGFEGVLEGADADLLPRPSRLVLSGERLVVLLSVYSRDFRRSGDARLAVVDTTTDAVVAIHRLEGLRGCSALAPSPDGERVAVGCSGTFGGGATPSLDDAGVAVVDVATGAITSRFAAQGALGGPPAFSIAFASPGLLLVPTFGAEAADGASAVQDTVVMVPIDGAQPTTILEGATPFSLGEVRCAPGCGTCFVADAGRDVLHRIAIDGASARVVSTHRIDDGLDLPPRYLGALRRE